MQRKLAAILAADVVGYSRLMGENENDTLLRLERVTTDVIRPLVKRHHGRIFKQLGDGFLVEFTSVVDALTCAMDWQDAVEREAEQMPGDQAIRFRIGVNLGDIIVKDDDVFGDGVNLAARLEQLAEPGAIFVSGTVCEHGSTKVAAHFVDQGEHSLKNIAAPVRVFKVTKAMAKETETPVEPPGQPTRKAAWIGASLVVSALIALTAYWFGPWRPQPMPEAPLPVVMDRPSIAVLPFANMSNDPQQAFLADGMTEDLITDLAKVSGLFVISRNSAFTYKGKAVKIREVSRELGVRYVLEGSIRRFGGQIRITGQLIDGETGGHVWAENYDGSIDKIFLFQDEVRARIIEALSVVLTADEKRSLAQAGTTNIKAYEQFLKGIALLATAQQFQVEPAIEAKEHFKQAIALDPGFGHAMAHLAWAGYLQWIYSNLGTSDELKNALGLARQSLELEKNAVAYIVLSKEHFRAKSYSSFGPGSGHDQAIAMLEKAQAIEPGNADVLAELAHVLVFKGEIERAARLMQRAGRLNPNMPVWYRRVTGMSYFFRGEYDKAVNEFRIWRDAEPLAADGTLWLAAAEAKAGRTIAAKETLAPWRRRYSAWTTLGLKRYFAFADPEQYESFERALIAAGVPGPPE